MIIDCHGRNTTAPRGLALWRDAQIAALNDPEGVPSKDAVDITDDEIRETLETGQLRLQREHGTDLVLFSPGAGRMAHHIGDATTSLHWSQHCSDLIHRACSLLPDNFAGVCQLPQSPGVHASA
jgi:4-oxalmesaconate hydratase